LPLNPALIGPSIYVQDAIFDPTVSQLGFITSNGIDISIGC
jgi:hypothetical protein